MVIGVISTCLGVLCLLYFAGYALAAGLNNSFTYVWMVFGAAGVGLPWLHRLIVRTENPWALRLEKIISELFLIALLIFLLILGRIIAEARKVPDDNADYIVVLGAHVYGGRMSASLLYRVEAACKYLERNPDTKAVLSGGQGEGEDISEAEAMRRYLEEQGIAPERILLEDTSTTTEENIRNTIQLIGSSDQKMVLVSNGFHIFRAKKVAEKQGCTNVQGLGARTHVYTVPNSYVREVVAVFIYMLFGKI